MTSVTSALTPIPSAKEIEALDHIVDRLRHQFPELPSEQIQRAVHGRYDGFGHSRIRDFVPVLVERSARDDLKTANTHRRA